MIVAKKLEENFNKVKELLNNNNIEYEINPESIIYTMEENNIVLGAVQARVIDRYAILDYILIDKKFRGNKLGDGLLRSILNYINKNNIKYIYCNYNNNFFINEGFEKIDYKETPEEVKNEITSDNILMCNIESFFSSGCHCKRR